MSINITGIIGINGGIQMSAPGSPPPQTYYSNLFDGNGDYLTISSGSGGNLNTGDFTIELWFYPINEQFTVFIQQREADWRLGTTDNRKIQFVTDFFGPGRGVLDSSDQYTLNSWNHLAVSRLSGTSTLYLNGISQGTLNTSPANSTYPVYIGVNFASIGPVWYFNCYISNVRIVKGTAVYTSNFTPPTAPLTAISGTSLLTCQSATIVDNSPNNFPITVNGDVAVSTQNPFN